MPARRFTGIPTIGAMAIFAASFICFRLIGRTAGDTLAMGEMLYSMPAIAVAACAALWGLVRAVLLWGERGRLPRWVGLFGILACAAGLGGGRLTSFTGSVVLTEGQEFSGFLGEYGEGTVRRGSRAEIPRLHVKMEAVQPTFSPDGDRLVSLSARSLVAEDAGQGRGEDRILSRWPRPVGDAWVRIGNFGYAPPFVVADGEGNVLDQAIVSLKLFPPGREDSFRILLPHTFTLRFEALGPAGNGETLLPGTGPAGFYHLRIARNKDLLVNRAVEPGEPVEFDNATITFAAPRRWVELIVTKDPALPVVIAGFLAFCASVIFELRNGRNQPHGPENAGER